MTVLYEDNHLIAVNKTCNELVQGDKTGDRTLIDEVKAYIKAKYNKPGEVFLGLPHRIDRPTSGIVLFARTSKALVRLNLLFQQHDAIRKTYWAIVQNPPHEREGQLEHYLIKNEAQNKSYVLSPQQIARGVKGKLARLTYRILSQSDRYTLLEIHLLTGRHHQIRCQLASIGCPIKGDLKYGAKRSNPDGGISLHARQIEFIHPVTRQPIVLTAPVPQDPLWQAFPNTTAESSFVRAERVRTSSADRP